MAGPIRVVLFGGSYLEAGAERFLVMLEEHPEIKLVGGFFQSEGMDLRHRWRNLWQRRRWMAIPVAASEGCGALFRWLLRSSTDRETRQRARRIMSRLETVSDLHAPEVIARVAALHPDVGVIYGAPVLRAELYAIPVQGTLGIHHGLVPKYRGRKTTFWAMYNGEHCAGVTIQRVDAGIDTGEVLRTGEVAIGRKSYHRVEREVQELGFRVYLDAILDLKHGTAAFEPQAADSLGLRKYRQPATADILRFYWRWLRRRVAVMGKP
jgi:folate-dependent phosphoribosylglycinamide formyltransferase PurN